MPALLAPIAAFLVAAVAIVAAYRLFGRRRPGPVTRGFRFAQLGSGGLLALAHGANDVQKTTGVITLALIANGSLGSDADPPFWAIVAPAVAIGDRHLQRRLADAADDGHRGSSRWTPHRGSRRRAPGRS